SDIRLADPALLPRLRGGGGDRGGGDLVAEDFVRADGSGGAGDYCGVAGLKAPSPGPRGPTSPPKGEVSLRDFGGHPYLSLWGRGRRAAAGEGALIQLSWPAHPAPAPSF